MTAYVDASVVLRLALGEGNRTVDLSPALLRRAGQHLPVPLGTLDAIHLATALSIGESTGEPFVLATHDRALARAARAVGLEATGD